MFPFPSPITTGKPLGCTVTQFQDPMPSGIGLNAIGVNAPEAWFTVQALNVSDPSLMTYKRPLRYVMVSESAAALPLPPLGTGKPGRSVSAPEVVSMRKP